MPTEKRTSPLRRHSKVLELTDAAAGETDLLPRRFTAKYHWLEEKCKSTLSAILKIAFGGLVF